MKNNILRIILFLTIIIVPPVSWIVIGNYNEDLYESLQVNLGEKRDLYEIEDPAELLMNGSVLTDYYADRAPYRNVVINLNRKLDNIIEKPYDKLILPAAMKLYGGKPDKNKTQVADKKENKDAFEALFGGNKEKNEAEEKSPIDEGQDPVADGPIDEPTNHNYVEAVLEEPTCYKTGLKKVSCTDCEYEEYVEIPKLSHEYELYNIVEASFEDYGCKEYLCKHCYKLKRDSFTDKPVDDSYLAPTIKQNEVIIGRSGWLFLAGDGNLNYYTRDNVLSDNEMQEYADKLSELNRLCVEKGKRLAVIVAPNKDQVYSEYMPSFTFGSEERRTEKLVEYIKAGTDVKITYPIDELKYAKRFWQLYYKCDSHWNAMGAFIGEQALLNLIGYEVTNPDNVELWWSEEKNDGDLMALGALDTADYPTDSNYQVKYKPEIDVVSLMEGDHEIMTYYKTLANVVNGEKCVLVGDSYRVKMIPFVSKEFSECAFVYRDNMIEAANDLAEADVIIIEAVERKDYTLLATADWLIDYLKKVE